MLSVMKIAGIDVFYGYEITNKYFTFSNEEPLNDQFEKSEIETMNYLLNTGSIIVPVLFVMILH